MLKDCMDIDKYFIRFFAQMQIITLLAAAFFVMTIGGCASEVNESKPDCIIDLTKPPQERWTECLNANKETYRQGFENLVASGRRGALTEILVAMEPIFADLGSYLGEELYFELQGIADTLGVNIKHLVALNAYFDLGSMCTTVLIPDSQNGIFLGRNLDLDPRLAGLLIDAKFVNGEKTEFRAVSIIGYPGATSGYRKGKLALSINSRYTENSRSPDRLAEEIKYLVQNRGNFQFVTWEMRKALEQGLDFEATIRKFSDEAISYNTDAYIIVAGVNAKEGAVITKNRNSIESVKRLDDEDAKKFIVQTNFDEANFCTNHSNFCPRYVKAYLCASLACQEKTGVTPNAVRKILFASRDPHSTLLASIMNPAANYYDVKKKNKKFEPPEDSLQWFKQEWDDLMSEVDSKD